MLTARQSYRHTRARARKIFRNWRADLEAGYVCDHPDRTALRSLRDRHVGQTGFLIGSGPSVRPEDLDRLKDEVTFCCNRFYLAYDRTVLRPTYLCCADPYMMRDFGQEMIDRGQSQAVMMSVLRPELTGDHLWIEVDSEGPFRFTENILRPIHPGGATLVGALQFGYWMGIRKFVLYGTDHSFPREKNQYQVVGTERHTTFVTGDGHHFIADYRSGKAWCAPQHEMIETSFAECDTVVRSQGGWVINATRTTQLPNIERVPFEHALELADLRQ